MDYLSQHRKILEDAAENKLPERINASSEASAEVVRELIEERYLKAIDACDSDGLEYLEPRITVSGREYLNHLQQRAFEGSAKGKAHRFGLRLLDWSGGIIAGLIIAWAGSNLL